MRRSFTVLALTLLCQPAFASGGLNCSADGEAVSFDVKGGVTHGMGGSLFSFAGNAKISDAAVAADLAATAFRREHVAQYWLDGKELRLRLYRERDGSQAHGYVEIAIETEMSPDDKGRLYKGRYWLNTYDMSDQNGGNAAVFTREGAVACLVE